MSAGLLAANLGGWEEAEKWDGASVRNPLCNVYRTADGRFVELNMIQADTYWSGLCHAIGRDDLAGDPRYSTIEPRTANRRDCIAALAATFKDQPLSHWQDVLSRQSGPWTVVGRVGDLNHDKQAWVNGYLQHVSYGDDREITLCASPAQFDETPPKLTRAPELGEHTEEVLLELGLGWDGIAELQDQGAII
jgi:crotonobetainyl-CoA:carnitine CoA-transferase CaiB-like acyl-CoA transferase